MVLTTCFFAPFLPCYSDVTRMGGPVIAKIHVQRSTMTLTTPGDTIRLSFGTGRLPGKISGPLKMTRWKNCSTPNTQWASIGKLFTDFRPVHDGFVPIWPFVALVNANYNVIHVDHGKWRRFGGGSVIIFSCFGTRR